MRTHTEETCCLGQYVGEDGAQHGVRIVEIVVLAQTRTRTRYRIDFAVPDMPGGWNVSLDGFASLAAAEDYLTMTTEVDWTAVPPALAQLAHRDCSSDSIVAWYTGGSVDAIEVMVELDDPDPVGRAGRAA